MFTHYKHLQYFQILLFEYSLTIKTADIFKNSFTLIIGITKYQIMVELNYPVMDAKILIDLLIEKV